MPASVRGASRNSAQQTAKMVREQLRSLSQPFRRLHRRREERRLLLSLATRRRRSPTRLRKLLEERGRRQQHRHSRRQQLRGHATCDCRLRSVLSRHPLVGGCLIMMINHQVLPTAASRSPATDVDSVLLRLCYPLALILQRQPTRKASCRKTAAAHPPPSRPRRQATAALAGTQKIKE